MPILSWLECLMVVVDFCWSSNICCHFLHYTSVEKLELHVSIKLSSVCSVAAVWSKFFTLSYSELEAKCWTRFANVGRFSGSSDQQRSISEYISSGQRVGCCRRAPCATISVACLAKKFYNLLFAYPNFQIKKLSHHLCTRHVAVWLLSVAIRFPECNTVAPYVTCMWKNSTTNWLWGIPNM